MKRIVSIQFANLFLWATVLAATFVLLWSVEELWLMVIVVLGAGAGSHVIVSIGMRNSCTFGGDTFRED